MIMNSFPKMFEEIIDLVRTIKDADVSPETAAKNPLIQGIGVIDSFELFVRAKNMKMHNYTMQ
jgi:hypothetical protein